MVKDNCSCTGEIKAHHVLTGGAHLAHVNDEAVPLVEAGPGHDHLRCPDGPAAFEVQQTLHVCVIGYHMLETRGHPPFLGQKK